MKKLISIILVVALLFGLSSSAFASDIFWDELRLPFAYGVTDYNENYSSGVYHQYGELSTLDQIINNTYASTLYLDQIAYDLGSTSSNLNSSLHNIYAWEQFIYSTLTDSSSNSYFAVLPEINTKLNKLEVSDARLSLIYSDLHSMKSVQSTTFDEISTINSHLTSVRGQLGAILTILSTIANNGGGGTVTFPNYIQINPWLDSGQWKTPGETGYNVDSWWWDQSFYQHMIANDLSEIKDILSDSSSSDLSSIEESLEYISLYLQSSDQSLDSISRSTTKTSSLADALRTNAWSTTQYSASWFRNVYNQLNTIANNTRNIDGNTQGLKQALDDIGFSQDGPTSISTDDFWSLASLFDGFKNFFDSDYDPTDLFIWLQDDELWSWFSDETAQSIDATTSSVDVVDYLGW